MTSGSIEVTDAAWRNGYVVGTDWHVMTAMAAAGAPAFVRTAQAGLGDLSGDGFRDILAADQSGALWVYRGMAGGGIGGATRLAGDWSSTTFMASFGDFDGNGYRDVVSVDTAGDLWLRSVTGGTFGTATKIGGGFNIMTRILSPGDFNGDRIPDLIAVDVAGDMWLYAGRHLNVAKIGTGFNMVSKVTAVGDFDGDSASDLLVRYPTEFRFHPAETGRARGLRQFPKLGAGLGAFRCADRSGRLHHGDGIADVLARKPNGDLLGPIRRGRTPNGWKPYRRVDGASMKHRNGGSAERFDLGG